MNNIDILYKITNIKQLKSRIQHCYFEIRLLVLQLKSIEQTIKNFTDEYYKSIGTLKNNITPQSNYFRHNSEMQARLKQYNHILDNKLKSIYRKLVLVCHPDITKNKSKEIFLHVTKAYKNKDLNNLLHLENTLCNNDSSTNYISSLETFRRLQSEYNTISEYLAYLKQQKHLLLTSPAYLLRKKVYLAREEGVDLIEKIKDILKSAV
ncbi:hypothetical protein NOVO_08280 [Rickettsiales bacterium Ac37b]|nr:hypothetical protein NOVO_08280 [Rickettsiales bacterium Ac37b]